MWCPATGTVAEVPCRFNSYAMQFDSITSNSTYPASSGFLALAANDQIKWRNNMDSADCPFGRIGGGDALGWGCGNFYFSGSKGQHFQNFAVNSDDTGTVATSSSTTASVTFTTAFVLTPVCVLTPQTTGLTSWYLSAIGTTGFTVTVIPSGTYTFGYKCSGNPV